MTAKGMNWELFIYKTMDSVRGEFEPNQIYYFLLGLIGIKFLHSKHFENVLGIELPQRIDWDRMAQEPKFHIIQNWVDAFENEPKNHNLRGIFKPLISLRCDDRALVLLANIIQYVAGVEISYEDYPNIISNLIRLIGELSGPRSGEFFTPYDLGLLLVDILNPTPNSSVFDPFCGTGSFLIHAYKKTRLADRVGTLDIFGQEKNIQTASIAKINLLFHGLNPDNIAVGDSLFKPQFTENNKLKKFDFIISDPPLNLRLSKEEIKALEKTIILHFEYGLPKRTANFAYIQHVLNRLNENGKAVVIVSPDSLFTLGDEGEIRGKIVESDLVEAVIALPADLLDNTKIPLSIMVMNKNKPESLRNKVLFIYASDEYEKGRKKNQMSIENRAHIASLHNEKINRPQLAKIIPLTEIKENGFNLTPAAYIDLVNIQNFLGGNTQLTCIKDMSEVLTGVARNKSLHSEGSTPLIRITDLSKNNLTVDDLEKITLPEDSRRITTTLKGDILLPRVGLRPIVFQVTEELENIVVDGNLYVLRLKTAFQHVGGYLIDFLNAEIGQNLLRSKMRGVAMPLLPKNLLEKLEIPIPDYKVMALLSNIRNAEKELNIRVEKAHSLRQRLFGIQEAEKATQELKQLSVDAQILSQSLIQGDDFEFQVRNFYPYVLAYTYRTLQAIRGNEALYKEQLRVGENILAFLGLIGLSFLANFGQMSTDNDDNLSHESLRKYWQGGISPGDWQAMGFESAKKLRDGNVPVLADTFAAIWFKGRSKRTSDFYERTKEIVKLKNNFKHDRWPKEPNEYETAVGKMDELLRICLQELAFFIQYPMTLALDVKKEWRSAKYTIDHLVYIGDHPGLRQEKSMLVESIPEGHLYIQATEDSWIPLYPLISVHYCHSCKTRETYFVDSWDGPSGKIVLKSFERGHTHENDGDAKHISDDLNYWLNAVFAQV